MAITLRNIKGSALTWTELDDNFELIPLHYNQEAAPTGTISEGSTWFEPSTAITYKWVNDGTSSFWIDVSTAAGQDPEVIVEW